MKNLILALSVVLVSTVANAGGFVEPYIGYATNKTEGTFAAGIPVIGGTNFDTESKGPVYGLRAGYKFILPWVALEASQFKGKTDDDPSNDVTGTDIGATVGLSLPIVRPYAGYVFSSKLKSDDTEFEGTAMKLGVGFGFLPLVHLNIEMVDTKFKEVDGQDLDLFYSDFKSRTTVFTVSYVF